ncbi:hypothetical protein COY62_01190 [bacterium (Candidatus Howlettbacteria) CG_4_10_14_0_8_um_filter_40_9]|nr:MAG: hypothetical protein COY62_01190 [bacterium (Candidatus Howlettbacteria) CG_4_10_14_0_8_um_filter_40_9]
MNNSEKPFSAGFGDILKDLSDQKHLLEKELETLPQSTETFTAQELQQIVHTKQHLSENIARFNQEAQQMMAQPIEYGALCDQFIEKTTKYLDSLDMWTAKFSTECSGGRSEGPLETTPDDSVYYMTSKGISLRLKKANRGKGLGQVIQPFFEKIVFVSSENRDVVERPELGFSVREYITRDFFNLQNQSSANEDYHSGLKIYYKNDRIFYIKTPDSAPEKHEGDRVNKIFT